MSSAPEAGDIVWLDFDPQSGHEQRGRRPALVLTPSSYNSRAGLMVACPITSKVKGYPFEVAIPEDSPVSGVILSDQLRSVDWEARNAEVRGKAPDSVMEVVRAKVGALLGI